VVNKIQNRLGLVNGNRVSIHHAQKRTWIWPVAFILDERRRRMVKRWCAIAGEMLRQWFLL
jgi:hypothetical protein